MESRTKRWLIAAALLGVGAAVEAAAVTLYWTPCAGQLIYGGIAGVEGDSSDFSPACFIAMDQAVPFALPQPGEGWTLVGALAALAGLLLAAAWLVVAWIPTATWKARVLLASPGLLAAATVGCSVVLAVTPAANVGVLGVLALATEGAVLVAWLTLGAIGVEGWLFFRYAVVALAATSTGMVHQFTELLLATAMSEADWDAPPGTGYLTVWFCLVAALLTVALWWRQSWGLTSGATSSPPAAGAPTPRAARKIATT